MTLRNEKLKQRFYVPLMWALVVYSTGYLALAQTKSFAYRTSNNQTFSNTLGVNCVPAYVMQGKVAHQGLFITSLPTTDLGREMKLSPGMVLLTVDRYSMVSAKAADNWLAHRSRSSPISFTYATDSNGVASVQSGSVTAGGASGGLSASGAATTATKTTGVVTTRNVLPSSSISGGAVPQVMLGLLNDSRQGGGLSALQSDSRLSQYAQTYADYLAAHADKYDVRDPNNNPHQNLTGQDQFERARQAGIENFLSENIGRNVGTLGFGGVKILHNQMMSSPGHRPAIMDAEAHKVGVGAAQAGNRIFLVEVFGR